MATESTTTELLLVPVDDTVVFPAMTVSLPLENVAAGERVLLVPRSADGEYATIGTVAEVIEVTELPRRMGAAAVDLCSVSCGVVDAFYERGLAPWDLAAGCLIAAEAGAVVTDLAGDAPSGAFVLAAAPAIAGPLRDLLRLAGAGEA